jgi:hypothetical protein
MWKILKLSNLIIFRKATTDSCLIHWDQVSLPASYVYHLQGNTFPKISAFILIFPPPPSVFNVTIWQATMHIWYVHRLYLNLGNVFIWGFMDFCQTPCKYCDCECLSINTSISIMELTFLFLNKNSYVKYTLQDNDLASFYHICVLSDILGSLYCLIFINIFIIYW